MDYKQKYLKYKTKYLGLKKYVSNIEDIENINIHGPVSCYYYNIKHPKIKINKKILLFGDVHLNYKYSKFSLDFINFLRYCIENNIFNNNCLDFFLENSVYIKRHIIKKGGYNTTTDKMIFRLRNFLYQYSLEEIMYGRSLEDLSYYDLINIDFSDFNKYYIFNGIAYTSKKEAEKEKEKYLVENKLKNNELNKFNYPLINPIDMNNYYIVNNALQKLNYPFYPIHIKNNDKYPIKEIDLQDISQKDWISIDFSGIDKFFIFNLKAYKTEAQADLELDKYFAKILEESKGLRIHDSDNSQVYDNKNYYRVGLFAKQHPLVIGFVIGTNPLYENLSYKLFKIDDKLTDTDFINQLIKTAKAMFYYLIGYNDITNLYIEGKKILMDLTIFLNNIDDISWLNVEEVEDLSKINSKRAEKLDKDYLDNDILLDYFNKEIDNIIDDEIFSYYNVSKISEIDEINVIKSLVIFVRTQFNDYHTIARMFSKFDDSKNRIQNCDNENSLKNIFYYGGNRHTTNIKKFIDFLITKNTKLELVKKLFEEEDLKLTDDNKIHRINLQKEILDDFNFNR